MHRLGIIADDLTGAIDCAAACRRRGLVAAVFPRWDAPDDAVGGPADVLVLVTDSRHCPESESRARVRGALRWLQARGCRRLYKKTDSAGRGRIGTELAALVAGGLEVTYVPAYPALGRTARAGRLLVHGVPVAESEFARDPLAPVTSSELRDIVGDRGAPLLAPDANQGGLAAGVLVCHGATDDDVVAAVRGALAAGRVVAGPAGILPALLEHDELAGSAEAGEAAPALSRHHLVVVGSQHPVTLAQLARAEECGGELLHLSSEAALGPALPATWVPEAAPRALGAWRTRRQALVFTARSADDVARYRAAAEERGLTPIAGAERLTERLAEATVGLAEACGCRSLVLCGGATSQAVLERLGVRRLDVQAELCPGMGLATSDEGYVIVTKNGAFGPVDALCGLMRTSRSSRDGE